jgi:superfamily II DNA/RNA helicase
MKELYVLFIECLGNEAYHTPTGQEPKDDRSRLFAMCHKRTHKLVKETVEVEFCKPDGTVRVLFCSVAFGMGVNIKEAHLVLHIGPPSDLDDYLQETGRVGRDLLQKSHAVLLKYKRCTASKYISKEMKEFVTNDSTCRRKLLLSHFGSDVPPDTILHDCFDVCSRSCKCSCFCSDECTCGTTCSQNVSEMERHLNNLKKSQETTHKENCNNVSQSGIKKLQDYLFAYRSGLARKASQGIKLNLLTSVDITTGYSISLINQIISNINNIKDEQYLKEHFAFFSDEHVQATWAYLCLVLNSPDSDRDPNTDDLNATDYSESDSCNDSDNSNSSIASSCKSYSQNSFLQTSNSESSD